MHMACTDYRVRCKSKAAAKAARRTFGLSLSTPLGRKDGSKQPRVVRVSVADGAGSDSAGAGAVLRWSAEEEPGREGGKAVRGQLPLVGLSRLAAIEGGGGLTESFLERQAGKWSRDAPAAATSSWAGLEAAFQWGVLLEAAVEVEVEAEVEVDAEAEGASHGGTARVPVSLSIELWASSERDRSLFSEGVLAARSPSTSTSTKQQPVPREEEEGEGE